MKKLFILLALCTAANAYALEYVAGSYLLATTGTGGLISTLVHCENSRCKQAVETLNDGQNYIQSGEMSLTLAQKVKDLQSQSDLSAEEALDLILSDAQANLK